jgi:hypothetical protein
MSMTLILWKAPVVDDPDEAEKRLGAWYETGDEGGLPVPFHVVMHSASR